MAFSLFPRRRKMPQASKWALRLPVKLLLGALLGAARGSAGTDARRRRGLRHVAALGFGYVL